MKGLSSALVRAGKHVEEAVLGTKIRSGRRESVLSLYNMIQMYIYVHTQSVYHLLLDLCV